MQTLKIAKPIPYYESFCLLLKQNCSAITVNEETITINNSFSTGKKSLGQYFTDPNLVKEFYEYLFSQPDRGISFKANLTILDLAAGKGDFLIPIIKSRPNFIPYGVEIDSYYLIKSLYSLLIGSDIPKHAKAKILLTFRNGNAIEGYSPDIINAITKKDAYKRALLEYRKERIALLSSNSVSEAELYHCLNLRYKLPQKKFNWFLDFPELFLDDDLNPILEKNFDFVVGNPPWISYLELKNQGQIHVYNGIKDVIHGKYNSALLFATLSHKFTKLRGGLVLPLGILTETYSHKLRKIFAEKMQLLTVVILNNNRFFNVNNEYAIVLWEKVKAHKVFRLIIEKSKKELLVSCKTLQPPKYLISTIPYELYEFLSAQASFFPKLSDIAIIRRGLTLTSSYRKKYGKSNVLNSPNEFPIKKIIRHNNSSRNKEGVLNFQIFYNNDLFVYDTSVLGAPGTVDLFEQPKIIRRNRGKLWFIALDQKGQYYINDIFDMVIPRNNKPSELISLFGYLSTSLVQYLMESYVQRDITSNIVRELPLFFYDIKDELEVLTNDWITNITKETTMAFRNAADELIFDCLELPTKFRTLIKSNTPLRWYDV